MAGKFVLTAQMQLQAPTNLTQVRRQIQQQLSNVVINPVINTQALANFQKQLQNTSNAAASVGKNLGTATRSAQGLGAALGAAARRFASITLATGFFLGLVRGISDAVGRAVEFEKEMLKISQVTGKTAGELRGLTKEVTRLATGLGVSSSELLNVARTLSQAGFSAAKTKDALAILARTDLAATFENLQSTTEGAIALLRQFRTEAKAAGGDIKFLEQSLDAINAVSKNFAVEAGDLIAVIRRTGGVFEAAGGKLNELIALFTSVRGTTRETAETIATGFRTIFTRIQRTETVEQLRELGIELRNAKGEFVGPLEAIKRLQIGLAGLSATDFRFQEIVEQLGGFRQVGKVIPLLKQYETTAEALAIANGAMGSTAADAAIAQQGLGNAFQKLKEKFDKTVRNIADSDTFQTMARGAMRLAESILSVVEALEPLLPLLTALAAFKLGQIAVPAFGKFAGIGGRNKGGRIYGFNKGGFVPGSGSKDTVPAMLTPGEFVIKKSSVNSIGAHNLARINGYNDGGEVDVYNITGNPANLPAMGYTQGTSGNRGKTMLSGPVTDSVKAKYGSMLANSSAGKAAGMKGMLGPEDKLMLNTPFINAPANKSLAQTGDVDFIGRHLRTSVHNMAKEVGSKLDMDVPPLLKFNESSAADQALKSIDLKTVAGYMFEAVASTLSGSPVGGGSETFDMPQARAYTEKLEKLFGGKGKLTGMSQMELKRTLDSGNLRGPKGSLTTKLLNSLAAGGNPFGLKLSRSAGTPDTMAMNQSTQLAALKGVKPGGRFFGGRIGAYNKGGSVDTVPAMLTPGEYVINKSAAESIGYTNLNRMNQTGVAHFNKGGSVGGVQFMARGGKMAAAGNAAMMATFMAPMLLEFTNMADATKKAASNALTLAGVLGMLIVPLGAWLDATLLGIGAQTAETVADTGEAVASGAAIGPFVILAVVITAAIAVIQYFNTQLTEAAKAALEAQQEMLDRARGGGDAVDRDELDRQGRIAVNKTATANQVSVGNMASITSGFEGYKNVVGRLMDGTSKATDALVLIPVIGPYIVGLTDAMEEQRNEMRSGQQAMKLLNNARVTEANAVGGRIAAMKEIETLDLEGAEKRRATIKANSDFTNSMKQLAADNNAFQAKIDSDPVAQGIMSQEDLNEAVEEHTSRVKDAAKQQQEIVREQRAALDEMISEMREGGASFAEVFGSPEYQAQLAEIGNAAAEAARLNAQATGESRAKAMENLGVTQAQLEGMSAGERQLMAARIHAEQTAYENAQAEEARQKAMEGTDKRQREMAEAEMKRARELASLKRAEMEALKLEMRRTQILNELNAQTLSYINTVSGFSSSIRGFSGDIQDAQNNVIKLAETLKDGFSPSAFKAAEKISPVIANNIREGLQKNKDLKTGLVAISGTGIGTKQTDSQKMDTLKSVGIDLDSANISGDMKAKILGMMEDGLDVEEINEIVETLGEPVEKQIEILKKLNDAQQAHVKLLSEAAKAEREAYKKINAANRFEVDVRQKGAARLRQATGREITVAEANAELRERVNVKTGGFGGVTVGALGNRASGLLAQRNQLQSDRDAGGLSAEADQRMANSQKMLNDEIGRTKEALKELADQSDLAAAVMGEIEAERGKREAVQQSIKDFTFATNEQRMGIAQEFSALTRVLQTGNLNAIPDQMRGAVGKLLDQFKDIEFFPGMTGGDISKRLQVQQMDQQFRRMSGGRQGVPPQLVKAIFESTTQEEKLINDLRAINKEEQAAATALRKLEQQEAQMMMEAAVKQIQVSTALLAWLTANANADSNELADPKANGGLVYRAGGGSIFKARGTDTVPAMLTPGEFVIRKSAVDKIGIGTLAALNNGNANTVYKAGGGLVADGAAAARYNARLVGARGIRMAVEKANGGDKAKGLTAFTAYRDNDLEKLIAVTGGEKSPLFMIRRYVNALKQYEFLFTNLTPTGLKLKDDPASVNAAAKALQNLREIYGRWDNLGLYPSLIGKEFQHNRMFLENALANPQMAAGGIKQDPVAPQNAGPANRRGLTPEQKARNKKKSLEARVEARKNKGLVPYPEFYEGKLVGYDDSRKIPYAEFVRLKREHEAKYAEQVAQETALFDQKKVELRQRMLKVAQLNTTGHPTSPPREYITEEYPYIKGARKEAQFKLGQRVYQTLPGSAFLRPQQERDWRDFGGYDDSTLANPPLGLAPMLVKSQAYAGWSLRSFNRHKERLARYKDDVMKLSAYQSGLESNQKPLSFEMDGRTFFSQAEMDAYKSAKLLAAAAEAVGFARGGSVDSVPAMLTPGEFVMSRSSVKKHGTGFMNAVNRGKVPGFNRGGSVGGVQYRQGGGMMSGMGSGLMEGISNALSSFEGIANILSSVASVFSDMSISHTVQVDGTLNIPGFSQEAINQIITVIGNQVVNSVSGKIDVALEQFKNQQDQRAD